MGLVGGLAFGLFFVLFSVLVMGLGGVLSRGLGGVLLFGLLFWFSKGGDAWIQHWVLRTLLWRYDYAPFRYVRFLEHAKDLLFLQRVGGGYRFRHRILMEHFAGFEGEERVEGR